MTRLSQQENADGGCFAVLSSCFKTKRKGRPPAADNPSSEESRSPRYLIENPRPTPLAAAPATCPDDLDASLVQGEIEERTQIPEDDLWQKAFEEMDEATKKRIGDDFGQSGDRSPVENLIQIVRDHTTRFKDSPTQIRAGEHTIIWRDCAGRVVDGLTILGDIAVQFAPSPSSIIWSALKVLLKTHVSECESLAAMLGCATEVLPLVRCGAVYEKVYLKDISNEHHESTTNLRDALVNLYEKILYLLAGAKHDLSKRGAERFLKALLNPGASEQFMQELNKAELRLDSAVQACQAVQIKETNSEALEILQGLDKPLRRIDETVETILETASANYRAETLAMLSRIRFGDQHLRRTKPRVEGTGQWLLKHPKFHYWETSSSSSILWLTGKIGAGKSTLASNVVDRYWVEDTGGCEPIDEGFAFFYYSKNDQELKGDPIAHILGSFLRQLSTVPHYPDAIYTKLINLRRHMEEKKISYDPKRCREFLTELVDLLPRTFIVLDGLDEIEEPSDVEEIVQFLVRIVEKAKRPVKIFISSRDETYIRDELSKAEHNLIHIHFMRENQPDILEYVQKRTAKIGHRWDPEVKQQVEKTLCDNAQGMFRWVYLQIEQLKTINSPEEVLERLKRLPRGLEEAYDELYNANIGWDQKRLKRAVKWVLYARSPLSTAMLLSAVQLGIKTENDEVCLEIAPRIQESALEAICRHLIVKDPQDNWRFSHASVEEYFRGGKHRSWASGDAQADLAQLSLLLIMKICGTTEMPEEDTTSLQSYVVHNWAEHLREIRPEFDNYDRISQLLKRFMIAQDCLTRSSLVYRRWLEYIRSSNSIIYWQDLSPANNPAFGIVALGLHTIAKQWGEDCLKSNLTCINDRGANLLFLAARYGHSELCGQLIEWGIDVNRTLPNKSSALVAAIFKRQITGVRKLLEYGANPNLKSTHSSLCAAIAAGCNPEVFELLLSYNAKPDALCPQECDFQCALITAAFENKLGAAEVLIMAGATVDVSGGLWGNPLAAAAFNGHLEMAKLLISHGADVNIRLETGSYGGVLAAAFFGKASSDVIVYLIENAGADPHRMIADLLTKHMAGLSTHIQRLAYYTVYSRENIARYLYSHDHVTLDELEHFQAQCSPDEKPFSSYFISNLKLWEAEQGS